MRYWSLSRPYFPMSGTLSPMRKHGTRGTKTISSAIAACWWPVVTGCICATTPGSASATLRRQDHKRCWRPTGEPAYSTKMGCLTGLDATMSCWRGPRTQITDRNDPKWRSRTRYSLAGPTTCLSGAWITSGTRRASCASWSAGSDMNGSKTPGNTWGACRLPRCTGTVYERVCSRRKRAKRTRGWVHATPVGELIRQEHSRLRAIYYPVIVLRQGDGGHPG